MAPKTRPNSKYYDDLIKMIPLTLAECKHSDEKCLIMGKSCMEVIGIFKEYDEKRATYAKKVTIQIKRFVDIQNIKEKT